MNNCKILAIANQKGGTGKTTTASNLGSALACEGKKVLLADFDPQANLTMSFGIEYPDELPLSMHNILAYIMEDQELPNKIEYIQCGDRIDIIPSNINLSITEINLRDEMGGERTLSTLLEPLREDYDYIIIDTNPYLGLLTINALAACDSVVIPVSPQLWSATGLTDLLKTILKVRKKINPRIEVEGILLTICDERTNLFREAKGLIDEYYKGKVTIFDVHIPTTVRVGEANYYSRSVMEMDPKNKAAIAYTAFAKEVMQRGNKNSGKVQTAAEQSG
ncbi:MAG TPA: chromosome partitioning protein ParA [Clostridiales bacterium]|nr:chromosome partitioning protein ParA [Clostridiales bacterium]